MAKSDSPESRLTEGLGLNETQKAELEARLKLRCKGCRLYKAEQHRKAVEQRKEAKAAEKRKILEMQRRPARPTVAEFPDDPWPAKPRGRWAGEYE